MWILLNQIVPDCIQYFYRDSKSLKTDELYLSDLYELVYNCRVFMMKWLSLQCVKVKTLEKVVVDFTHVE